MSKHMLARDSIITLVTVCKLAQASANPMRATICLCSKPGPVSMALKEKLIHSSASLFALLVMQG